MASLAEIIDNQINQALIDLNKIENIDTKNFIKNFNDGYGFAWSDDIKMKDVYEYTSPRALSAYIDSCIVETKIGIKGFDIGADVNTIPLLRTTELDSFYNKRRKCLVVFLQMMV